MLYMIFQFVLEPVLIQQILIGFEAILKIIYKYIIYIINAHHMVYEILRKIHQSFLNKPQENHLELTKRPIDGQTDRRT